MLSLLAGLKVFFVKSVSRNISENCAFVYYQNIVIVINNYSKAVVTHT